MTFSDYKTWCENVLNPRDRTATLRSHWCFETEDWHRHYRGKHDLVQAMSPKSILEIGVRYGYSAHAFLTGAPEASYIGVDCDDGVLNAMGEPTCDWAMTMLSRTVPRLNPPSLVRMNTQTEDLLARVPWVADFVHIDADHSYHGATRDIMAAWQRCSRAMLVDDYVPNAAVHDAVDSFVGRVGAKMVVGSGPLGEALIFKVTA